MLVNSTTVEILPGMRTVLLALTYLTACVFVLYEAARALELPWHD